MFLAGGFGALGAQAVVNNDSAKASAYGSASASMIFIFTAVFGATWLTVPWLYPAEIFPLAVRAKGNAWGVVGWSIGNGWLVSHPFLTYLSIAPIGLTRIDSSMSHHVLGNQREDPLYLWCM